jgi:nanoRNase/pAp phosphatase (c-di-AMP/oligoRNAs hydrolase)
MKANAQIYSSSMTGKFLLLVCLSICLQLSKAFAFLPATFSMRHPSKSIVLLHAKLQGADDAKIVDVEASATNMKQKDPEAKKKVKKLEAISARYIDDNGLVITTDDRGRVIAVPAELKAEDALKPASAPPTEKKPGEIIKKAVEMPKVHAAAKKVKKQFLKEEIPKDVGTGGFNVVLTHCTADFDTLASAVGLAKLWANDHPGHDQHDEKQESTGFHSSKNLPTFVVLPRGAHPAVEKFLALHKHLFPIRSLRSLPSDLTNLNRLGLVDAQRRDRVGPAEHLISYASRVTIVDHHIEGDSDIPEATDYVIDKVGSVSAMIAEQLRDAGFELTEAEATLLALGIHSDTGSLCFDSTTVRDAEALAWVMSQGASQAAIAEHAHSTLSREQQGVLTNALINTNSTVVHGVTVSTVLLR